MGRLGRIWDATKKAFGMPSKYDADEEEADQNLDEESTPHEDMPLVEDHDYVRLLESYYEDWRIYRYAFEPGWYQNVAFYVGIQNAMWNYSDRQLQEGKAPSYRVRKIINLIQPAMKTQLGKFLANNPQFNCRPKQMTDTAYSDAIVSGHLLRAKWRDMDTQFQIHMMVMWGLLTGTAFMKTGWDPTLGEPIETPGMDPIYPGDVDVTCVPPINILLPPNQMSIDKPCHIMEHRAYPLHWVRRVFGAAARDIQPDDFDFANTYEWRIASLVAPAIGSGFQAKGELRDMVIVKELWTDPQLLSLEQQRQFPKGRVLIEAQGKLLYKETFPDGFNSHPYTVWISDLMPGRFLGTTVVDQAKPMQISYNRARSQVDENRNLTANAPIDVEKGHGIARLNSSEPGQVCDRLKGWAAPEYRIPPQMNQYLVQSTAQDLNDMKAVFQQRDVTQGDTPVANATAPALETLQEADNLPMAPAAQRLAECFGKIGDKVVAICQKLYTEDRFIEVVGPQQETDIMIFRGDLYPTRVRVQCSAEALLPQSQAARMARVNELVTSGVLDPSRDRAGILEVYRFASDQSFLTHADLDRQKALRENRRMIMSQLPLVDTFDNDEVHMWEHDRFRKSPEYDRMSPEIRMIFDQHCAWHIERLQALMAPVAGVPQQGSAGGAGSASLRTDEQAAGHGPLPGMEGV